MRKFMRAAAGVVSTGVLSLLALTIYVQATLPDQFHVATGEEFYINSKLAVSASSNNFEPKVYDKDGNSYSLTLRLFDSVPVKQVQVQVNDRKMVIPGGNPFGIKMFTEGVMVVGLSDIQVDTENVNPAKLSGIKVGDIITHIDKKAITRNEEVASLITESEGKPVTISYLRNNESFDVSLTPVRSEYDDSYKAGIWVRDSSAGIGTMTYCDPETGKFAGLGHAICDIDTGDIMPLGTGEIVDVNISGVNAGFSGNPGELKGSFSSDTPMGQLIANTEYGIFGILDEPIPGQEMPMAHKQEVQPGPATIMATISGNKPQSFDIVIEKVNYSDTTPTKNMVITVVDENLLEITGGIVQGMSGSPIIQDGKLVGAVTHVFVNDPTRGFGIFAENMEERMDDVENNNNVA